MKTSTLLGKVLVGGCLMLGGTALAAPAPSGDDNLKVAPGVPPGLGDTAPPPFAPPVVQATDRATIQKLHDANQMEIEMGKVAQEKGSTKAVREFGRRLVLDHTAADKKLDGYLRQRGADLTALATTTAADPDHEMLATKGGTEFDRAFGQQMIRDHQKALDLLASARVETADDSLRMLYDQFVQTIQAHKRVAEDIVAASARS
jgi:putative membrane protein